MASVPSAGCLLAKNQYYRSECSARPGAACCPQTRPRPFLPSSPLSAWGPVSNAVGCSPLAGLPELVDKYWWIKSFFHSEPSPPTVGRKTLSAS
ncbi:PDPFL protein, partial [Pteruthius melanotis]|nr:PDPFL protein [Pteruthius melanotis]